jgi:hypothetical protein
MEVGGGALHRGAVKVGVMSNGGLDVIPRPQTLGHFLLGALGEVATVDNLDGSYTHTFTLPTDQFDAPYWTFRGAPGNLLGEQFQDCRMASLVLRWRGADFLRGNYGVLGGLPTKVSTGTWNALAAVDGGPQFIAPTYTIEIPTGSAVKVLEGAFTSGLSIPMDEQWITGSYTPDDFDINQRAFALTLGVKLVDADLYTKIAYDPAAGSNWVADIFREADITISFQSDQEAATGVPYELTLAANGQSGANANIEWSVQPIRLRSGRQVVMVISGTFTADPLGGEPITVTLTNQEASY